MQDDEATLSNTCMDLISLKKMEAFPLNLLRCQRLGEWVGVREFCLEIGVAMGDVSSELFATWLSDPMAHDGYVLILFYDDKSKWSMAAHYHRARILGGVVPTQVSWPTASAVPISRAIPSLPPAASVEL